MTISVKIKIVNKIVKECNVEDSSVLEPLSVNELDEISVEIETSDLDPDVSAYIEGYEVEIEKATQSLRPVPSIYIIQSDRYFINCWGRSDLRIIVNNKSYQIPFNIQSKKNLINAKELVIYVADKYPSIMELLGSRSKIEVSPEGLSTPTLEMVISSAEQVVGTIKKNMPDLLRRGKDRLISIKKESSSTNNHNIDPFDVLANIDRIQPCDNYLADLYIADKPFGIQESSIASKMLTASSDVYENQVILGAVQSISNKIKEIHDKSLIDSTGKRNHENFDEFIHDNLKESNGSLIERCSLLQEDLRKINRALTVKLKVTNKGALSPILTANCKYIKMYRDCFKVIKEWYQLGSPSLESINSVFTSIKSLSKLYELYALIRIINNLSNKFNKRTPVYDKNKDIPSKIKFENSTETSIILHYEYKIKPTPVENREPGQLIDIAHKENSPHYWVPDFVLEIRIERLKLPRYLVLDAKYADETSVSNNHLPEIVSKYYRTTAVVNALKTNSSRDEILGVLAIYPKKPEDTCNSLFHKESIPRKDRIDKHKVDPKIFTGSPDFPVNMGISTSLNNVDEFDKYLSKILEISVSKMKEHLYNN